MRNAHRILAVASLSFSVAVAAAHGFGQTRLKVGVYADDGASGIGAVEWFRIVHDSPEMELKLLDGAAVRAGGLDGLDDAVMIAAAKTLGCHEILAEDLNDGQTYCGMVAVNPFKETAG